MTKILDILEEKKEGAQEGQGQRQKCEGRTAGVTRGAGREMAGVRKKQGEGIWRGSTSRLRK